MTAAWTKDFCENVGTFYFQISKETACLQVKTQKWVLKTKCQNFEPKLIIRHTRVYSSSDYGNYYSYKRRDSHKQTNAMWGETHQPAV